MNAAGVEEVDSAGVEDGEAVGGVAGPGGGGEAEDAPGGVELEGLRRGTGDRSGLVRLRGGGVFPSPLLMHEWDRNCKTSGSG